MVELLAPAGNFASVAAALDGGADAIYVGGKRFSAREGAENFDDRALEDAAFRAHLYGARLYFAANTLVKEGERAEYLEEVRRAAEAGADAVIVQDPFLIKSVREATGLPVHLSTQAGVCNAYGARLARKMGAARVILARETPLEEIERVANETETEVFVQGALCASFSGHCLMSSFAGCNSANRGRCKQPCRKRYRLEGEEGYLLSLADLSVGEGIFALLKAGVSSFKIEGRMRSPEYVYAATRYYRDLLEGKTPDFDALKIAYNRGDYTPGYAFHAATNSLRATLTPNHIGAPVGKIAKSVKKDLFEVRSAYRPTPDDGFKVLRAGKEVGGGKAIASTPDGFLLKGPFRKEDEVRLTATPALHPPRKIPFHATVQALPGTPLRMTLTAKEVSVTATGEPVLPAKTKPLDEATLASVLEKTDSLPFALDSLSLAGRGFLPRSALNETRRTALSSLARALADSVRTKPSFVDLSDIFVAKATEEWENIDQWHISEEGGEIDSPADYGKCGGGKYLRIPAFFTERDAAQFDAALEGYEGVYAEGLSAIGYAMERGKKWIAGTGMNVFQEWDIEGVRALGGSGAVLSTELSEREAGEIRARYPQAGVLGRGGALLMEFCFCPYGGKCAGCGAPKVGKISDEEGRTFLLRRVRYASGCRFELYNFARLEIPAPPPVISNDLLEAEQFSAVNQGHWRRPL